MYECLHKRVCDSLRTTGTRVLCMNAYTGWLDLTALPLFKEPPWNVTFSPALAELAFFFSPLLILFLFFSMCVFILFSSYFSRVPGQRRGNKLLDFKLQILKIDNQPTIFCRKKNNRGSNLDITTIDISEIFNEICLAARSNRKRILFK